MEYIDRSREEACVSDHLAAGECCSIVGLSNTGKSTLLRALCKPGNSPPSPRRNPLFLYVDCNRMLDLSEQGFYEAILRTARSGPQTTRGASDLEKRLEQAYEQVVAPRNPLAAPLGFNDAMEGLCETGQQVVLILDEFDEPFKALEGRTFLNLRALRDRYREGVIYVTATTRMLEEIRSDPETAEFRESFAGRVCRLAMLRESEAQAQAAAFAAEEGTKLTKAETDFAVRSSGGHPGLLRGVVRLLARARTAAPQTYDRMGVSLVEEALVGDAVVQGECEQLWSQLMPAERDGLLALARGDGLSEKMQQRLRHQGLVNAEGLLFGQAFASFVRRQGERRTDLPQGVWLDEDAGEVYVDGQRTPTLTDLEYRLLQALYRRKDKLCDKYHLVEEVWGESYIDEVDDARIEKLVSRTRAKIERDAINPCYLVTVRGRGYRLQSRPRRTEQ